MPDDCCRVPEAGSSVCELPAPGLHRPAAAPGRCPECAQQGKPVQAQTVKSLLAVSLRAVPAAAWVFCRNPACPVAYFSDDGRHRFAAAQLREGVYQKNPNAEGVLICYCFQYTAASVRLAPPASQRGILDDITAGIEAGQCACDLRNPQGSCCLGNVRALIRATGLAGAPA
jgi:hypothetical protein